LVVYGADMDLVCRHVGHMPNIWVETFVCKQCRVLAQTFTFDCGILTAKWKAFAS